MNTNKLARLRESLAALGAEALLVTAPANVRYLSGFSTPEDGRVLVTEDRVILLTDARYTVQARQEVRCEAMTLPKAWAAELPGLLSGRRLAVEADHLSLAAYQALAETLKFEPVASEGLVAALRLVKDETEIAHLRQAAALTDQAYGHILNVLAAGKREVEIALELERFMRLAGAEGKSFEIIVASGPRGAMPHGVASNKVIEAGELVTLDFGAKVAGYHADMTRTVAVGEVSERLRELFDATLDAQRQALAALRPGKQGRELDALARQILKDRGEGEHIAHGVGHGVGLAIHEGPSLSKDADAVLEPGMTVTIEPGLYLAELGGVRIEDLALVTADGAETLSKSPKSWLEI